MGDRERRAGVNQAVFREVNERLRDLNATFTTLTDHLDLICECADPACTAQVRMVPEAYEALRADPRRFVVAPGHEHGADVERVVERADGYDVVEKHGEAGETAEHTDPRAG